MQRPALPHPPPTARLDFRTWAPGDGALATLLWGDPRVTALIGGPFGEARVGEMLEAQLALQREAGVQYWPVFLAGIPELAGCCGVRPRAAGEMELGFHFRPQHWGKGLATEAARAVIAFAFEHAFAQRLFAGHHPSNAASGRILRKLGFRYSHDELYPPTRLHHPSYVLTP